MVQTNELVLDNKGHTSSPASKLMAVVFDVTRHSTSMKAFPTITASSPSSRPDIISSAMDLTVAGNLLNEQVVRQRNSV